MSRFRIIPMTVNHWDEVCHIYAQGMDTGIATFETELPQRDAWWNNHLDIGRLVAVNDTEVTGWAALSPVSARWVYRGVAEVSIYVHSDFTGQGIGDALLKALIRESESHGIWTLHSAVFPQNQASINLHLKNGFRILGVRQKIAQRNGVWYDNVLLERRSDLF